MKKKKTIIIIFIFIILLSFTFFIINYNQYKIKIKEINKIKDITNITLIKTKNCENKIKTYCKIGNKKVYTNCLDNITINDKVELKDYLKVKPKAMEEIIKKLTFVADLKDGGTSFYVDNNNLSNHKLSIIKCRKLPKQKNHYYIGDNNFYLEKNYCE